MSKQNFIRTIAITALTAIGTLSFLHAQTGGPAVEQWKSFLPYNQVNGVATDGATFFCSTTSGFFTYNREDGTMNSYSKVNGMSDVGMTGVGYDKKTKSAILTYTSSNIDIFRDGTFYNLPDLKIFPVSGDKTIHDVYTEDGLAYLSTGIGLMIVNVEKKENKTTVVFSQNSVSGAVYAATTDNSYVYAATNLGLFRILKNDPFIQNDKLWTMIDTNIYHYLANSAGTVYAAEADSLFEISGAGAVSFKERIKYDIAHLDAGNGGLWISASENNNGFGILRTPTGSRADSFSAKVPSQVVQLAGGEVWFGDQCGYGFSANYGLRKKTAVDRSEAYIPVGPVTSSSFDVSAYNGELWVAHGGKDFRWNPTSNRSMFSFYANDKWDNYPYISNEEWFQDFTRVLKDQATGKLYIASYSGGLYERNADGTVNLYRGDQYFSHYVTVNEQYLISGLALDKSGNLWMTSFGGLQELSVKTPQGEWYKMKSVDENNGHTAADVIVDDFGQKWFIAVAAGGAVVYSDNGTIDNTADDDYRILKTGAGAGNLPDNNTLSIAKDKDGAIWIGTANGIGIVNCPDQVLAHECESTLKIVQLDEFAGYLFQGQSIKAIAIDGANRKWIGTTNGVWLLSDDAEKIVYRFTEDNSPLPSNSIERINIDPVTGDVYISTDKGLVSFRSTATEGKEENDDKLFIYPNPVPAGFEGLIAVRGLAENSDVRFTDISGQMVYRTKALGGQAVWNGKDYTGHKVQSGVYLVFVVNKDGTQKATGKLMIHN